MKQYYEAELRLLQESAQEFAQAYPEQARALKLNSLQEQDPYVERLIEATAYLSAQIRQRIDDDVPEVCETLLQQLVPNLLKPLPAATILQITPKPGQLQQTLTLPRGTQINSQPVMVGSKQIAIPWQTTSPCQLQPLRIIKTQLREGTSGNSVLELTFQSDANVNLEQLQLDQLTFYLAMNMTAATLLYYALTNEVEKIAISANENNQSENQQILGGQELIQPAHLSAEDYLLPAAEQSYSCFQLLQEYFAFREKFLFVTLNGLSPWVKKNGKRQFTLSIQFAQDCHKEIRVENNSLRLNCVPVINLFQTSAEPIRYSPHRHEYPIQLTESAEHALLYQIESVSGVQNATGETIQYTAITQPHLRRQQQPYYHTSTRALPQRTNTTYIMLAGEYAKQPQTISCLLTATYGQLPRMVLPEFSRWIPGKNLPAYLEAQNLLRPTAMLLPPQRADYRWALLSQLSLNYRSLLNAEDLQTLLKLYDWSQGHDQQKRISGIQAVKIEFLPKIEQGMLRQYCQLQLTMAEQHYTSHADLYFFGLILHHFFQAYIPLNMGLITTLIAEPSQRVFTWKQPFGASSLL